MFYCQWAFVPLRDCEIEAFGGKLDALAIGEREYIAICENCKKRIFLERVVEHRNYKKGENRRDLKNNIFWSHRKRWAK